MDISEIENIGCAAAPRPEANPRESASPKAERLEAIARILADEEALWGPHRRHDPDERHFARLVRTDEYEAWLLTWTSDQGVELHDHGGSSGVVLVLEGELVEHATEVASAAPLRETRWPRGSAHAFGPGHVHDLRNAGDAPATSIHVYSPPLSTMTFYDHRTASYLKPLRIEVVERCDDGEAPSKRRSIDRVLTDARGRLTRVGPEQAALLRAGGGLLVDIRPSEQRAREGEIPGALLVERNVLEWRLDPASDHRLGVVTSYEQPIVIVCSEGYASSLAAASLQDLGLVNATDLAGGFRAWEAAGLPVRRAR